MRAFLSEFQMFRGMVLGLKTNTENRTNKQYNAGVVTKVWDNALDQRRPVLIRIQNTGTEPIFYSEDTTDNAVPPVGSCDAVNCTGILAAGSAANDGLGSSAEWQRHIPNKIYIYGANAYNCIISLRYADEA